MFLYKVLFTEFATHFKFIQRPLPLLLKCNTKLVVFNFQNVRLNATSVNKTKKLMKQLTFTLNNREYDITNPSCQGKLEELLRIKPNLAVDLINRYDKLAEVSPLCLETNFAICKQHGVLVENLKKHPEVLAQDDVELKLETLSRMSFNINQTMPLVCLRYYQVQMLVEKQTAQNKIGQLSRIFEMSVWDVCLLLIKRPFLISLNHQGIEANVQLLKGYGIQMEDILDDLWVLKYSNKMIKERLDYARLKNIDELKTWMVRAKTNIFDNYVKRRSDNKLILGNNSVAEYLSKRLECTEDVAKYLISKLPALKNKSLKLVEEIIDFLYMKGFKPIHISRVPKILMHSVETTKQRIFELESQGYQIDSLYILTKSKKQYLQIYDALVKANKKAKIKSAT